MENSSPLERATALLRQEFSATCASVDVALERRQEALWLHLSFTPLGEEQPRRLSHVVAAVDNPKEAAVRIAVRSALDELRSGINFVAGFNAANAHPEDVRVLADAAHS